MPYSRPNLLDRLRCNATRRDWDEFVDLYGPLLECWAQRLAPPEEPADLLQDVILLVMRKLQSFRGRQDSGFLAWLRMIILNRRRDLARRARTRPASCDPALLGSVPDAGGADAGEREGRTESIRRALNIMQTDFEPSTWRACWESIVAERPIAEVAAELGISVAVVYSARHRVIRRLRTELATHAD